MEVHLLTVLEDMTSSELKMFTWYLLQDVLEGFPPIRRSQLENADRFQIVDKMIQTYRPEGAFRVTLEILKLIRRNDLVFLLNQVDVKRKDVEVPTETFNSEMEPVVEKVVDMLKNFKTPNEQLRIIDRVKGHLDLNKVLQYDMTSLHRGICLIINNKTFCNSDLKTRNGSAVDAMSLARVFSWLGFWVVMTEDDHAQDMRDVLKLFADLNQDSLSELKKCCVLEWAGERRKFVELDGIIQHGAAFVCCLMSHGSDKGIYGADSQILSYDELFTFFSGSNCSALTDKPKLFFIQACRNEPQKRKRAVTAKASLQQDAVYYDDMEIEADAEPGLLYNVTNDSDMLIAWATVDKQKSLRDPKTGSWFVQSLCKQLALGCLREEDILTILTKVNDQVSQGEELLKEDNLIAKQLPEVKYRLLKRLVIPISQ